MSYELYARQLNTDPWYHQLTADDRDHGSRLYNLQVLSQMI